MESSIPAKYRLGKLCNKYLILDIIFTAYFRKKGLTYLFRASKNLMQLLKENLRTALGMSKEGASYALQNFEKLACTRSSFDLPQREWQQIFVETHGDRLYTQAAQSLLVYSLADLRAPIASYTLEINGRSSGLITNNHLYMTIDNLFLVYKLNSSESEPLQLVAQTYTIWEVSKILRVGKTLLLGENFGFLEIFDLKTRKITHKSEFDEGGEIIDMVAIDEERFMLATIKGLLKVTKDQVIYHYFRFKTVNSVCACDTSGFSTRYLLGLRNQSLILWDDSTCEHLLEISLHRVYSIKRLLPTS